MELSLIDARRAVWIAQADLFLDTDVRLHYVHLAQVAAGSPYSIAELEEIFRDEVAPVYESNLLQIAGEWAGWPDAAVVARIEEYLAGNPPRPYAMATQAFEDWLDVAVLVRGLRLLPPAEWAARVAVWRAMQPIFLDSGAPRPAELPERWAAEKIFREEMMPAFGRKLAAYNDPTRAEVEARWESWRAAAQT